jgi:DNA-directed RNA polymerase specialized sigma24 family protein
MNDRELTDRLDELCRLLALQLRLDIGSQTQTIIELNRLGFSTGRTAELLGTTSNTVNVTVQKAKKRKRSGPRTASRGESDAG